MTENEWTSSICNKLKDFCETKSLNVDTLRKIPYSQEIIKYSEDWEPIYYTPTRFETDLVIYEKSKEMIVPRVIIESKLGDITTHDAITYSYKADKHKIITPYLRYGVMIGNRKNHALPGRLFKHGSNFDFMFSFFTTVPNKEEWDSFTKMLIKEVKYSRDMEKILHDSRSSDRKHYYMLQKQLVLKEVTEEQ